MEEVDDLDELTLLDDQELEEEEDLESLSRSDLDSEDADEDEEEQEAKLSEDDYNRLKFTVVDIITAMGGVEEEIDEDGQLKIVYMLGDDCLRCLRDLRKLWRQDEDNPNRTIPRIYAEVNVLQTGLLPLLLKTTSMGESGRKIALACTDLLATITWPIDYSSEKRAAEQKEEVDPEIISTLYVLRKAMISYKSAILRTRSQETSGSKRSVLSSIMLLVLLPCLSKARHERTERDLGVINMCLHLFRNLLAINDPIATSLSSSDEIATSRLQSDLIVEMSSSQILDTLLMLCSNANSKDFDAWNVVSCECVYYIFARSIPEDVIRSGEKATSKDKRTQLPKGEGQRDLSRLLAAETNEKREIQMRNGTTRHSRFSTMINFIDRDGNRRMASGQAALKKSVEQLTFEADAKGKSRIRRKKELEEKGTTLIRASWTHQALQIISSWADRFVKFGFESLTRSVLEDIRRERPKVGDLDEARTRVMKLGEFFLEYFMQKRQAYQSQRQALAELNNLGGRVVTSEERSGDQEKVAWSFDLVQQWLEPWALRMAYVRCSSSHEKKQWSEYIAAINLWTTLFKLVDQLWKSEIEAERELAEGILANHFYDQIALDSAKCVFTSYGSRSFTCLRAIIALAHMMPRMLEKYSKNKEYMYVKAKRQVRTSKAATDANGTSLAEDEQEAQIIAKTEQMERKFEFEKFQGKMCSQKLAVACLSYLSRWKEFQSRPEEQLYNVIQVMHRLIVKAGDHRLFFPYARRAILKSVQDDFTFWSFVKMQASRVEGDARKLIEYVLRKFNKLDEVEKERWAEGMGAPKPVKVFKMPTEIEISPSRGHMDDIGIAVGLMLEKERMKTLMWIKGGLEEAVKVKKTIIDEERELSSEEDGDDVIPLGALNRFVDHELLYGDDQIVREECSTLPEVKLLCRLLGLKSEESDTHRWTWTVPADALPDELEKDIELIEDFLRRPLETFGERFESMVQKVRKKKAVPVRTIINEHGDEEEVAIRKIKSRRKEKSTSGWVDNDFIEDSDEELEIVARLIKERNGNDVSEKQVDTVVSASEEERSTARGKSVSAASSISRSSPPSSSASTPRQSSKAAPRSRALFLGSDDEDQEEDAMEDNQGLLQRERNLAKRALIMSEDEEVVSAQTQLRIPQKKRRALIDDDDD